MPVMFCQFHHAVLHDVERGFLVSNVVDGSLESAFFHALQKIGEFLFSCQEIFALERPWVLLVAFGKRK